jgi:fatty acid desaturase
MHRRGMIRTAPFPDVLSPVFKYPADRLPVALILAISVLDFAVYLILDNVWVLAGYWLLLVIPKGVFSAWNHHHQHVHTFKSNALNRLYEIFLAFHSGITTNLWLLHHNLGHHLHFLDQSQDESAWQRKDGTTKGVLAYSVNIAVTAYYRAYQVGKKHKKHQRLYLIWTAITFALVAALVWYRPIAGLFIYVLPMMTSLLFTAWVTYDHHSGLDTKEPFEASYNIMNRTFNVLTGNLGYHTAHHHRQAVHWSKLPELHQQIAEKIPRHLYRKSTFDFFFPGEHAGGPTPDDTHSIRVIG